ncbi:MAG: methylmalonyl-CoA mutase family protein [Robiginitomaculum sp.]|nr:methylmalonyl-CoA mutase family protein [Robiginitomaculum sp.]
MTDHILDLADGFTCGTEAQWRALTDKALRGADYDETLVRYTEDGIQCGPLFTDAPKSTRFDKVEIPQLAGRAWHITTEIDHPDIAHANKDLLADLEGGASAIALRIDPSGKRGIAVRDRSDLQRLLSGVMTNLVPLSLVPSTDNFYGAALLAEYFKNNSQLKDIHMSLGYVPHKNVKLLVDLAQWVKAHAPHWKAVSIDARTVHEAGASPAQELAAMLAQAVQTVRNLQNQRFDIDNIFPLMDIHLSSDQDGHMGIVKFRAARLVWAQMAESFGASDTRCTMRVTSSRRMMSKMDPWSNMLRLGGATFGAVCGGADYITTLPFTQPLGLATPFARRSARNQQLLLMEESHLGQVSDPASGSYTHETLTHALAKSAWGIFQEIESRGGWAETRSWFKDQITAAHKTRMTKIGNGETLLVGVNQFTKPDVRKAEILSRPKILPKSGAEINTDDFAGAISQISEGKLLPLKRQENPFKPVRLSEEIERQTS